MYPHLSRTDTVLTSHRTSAFHFGLITLAINIASLALPILAMQVYDRIITHNGVPTLYVLTIATAIAIGLETALRIGRAYLTASTGASCEHILRIQLIAHCLRADMRALHSIGNARLIQSMDSVANLREFYSGQAIIAFIDVPFICIFIALIAYIGGMLAIIPLLLIAAFALRTWLSGRALMERIITHERIEAEQHQAMTEILTGIHTIKAYAAENRMLRRYEALQSMASHTSLSLSQSASDANNDGIFFAHAMTIAVLVAGAYMSLQGTLSMGALVACMLLSGRIMMPLQRILSLWVQYQGLKIAQKRIHEIQALPCIALPIADTVATPQSHTLTLTNVSFRFTDTSRPMIQNLSLEVEIGTAIAIHGASGSGKSTLLKLIAGIYSPDNGDIRIGGIPIHTLPPATHSKLIGYLPTKGSIFNTSLDNNLSGYGSNDESSIVSINALLGIDHAIARLPSGFDTLLENTPADAVPPGLKQRVCIARILATKPRIILYDNADRALDKEGYNYIFRLLARIKGKATLILVSEDHNVLRLADTHYHLNNGILSQSHNHGISNESPSIYRELRL